MQLKNNRKTFLNLFKLALFISFIDIVLFSLHRILVKYDFTNPDYYNYIISDFTWINYTIFFLLSFIVFITTLLFLIIVPKNTFKISIKKNTFVVLLVFLSISSFYVFLILQDFRPRYTKGSITSFDGIFFMLNNILLLCLYTIYILNRSKDNFIFFVILLLCSILTIDGLAKGLFTLAIIIFEFYRTGNKKKYFFWSFIIVTPIIIYISLNFKYSYRSDDFSILTNNFESILIYIYDFAIPRISVHGEHLNAFISNKLDISNYSFLANVISESFNNRLKIIFNDGHDLFYPKTVGQSITFNVRGTYDRGGSSPGYVLSVISFLPFTLPLIFLISSIFKTFILRLNEKLTFIEIACLCYIFKAITANLLDMLGLISTNLLLLFLIYLSCNIYFKDSNKKKFIYN